jgi:hypothetical protein
VILGPSITSVLRLLLPRDLPHDLAAAQRSLQGAAEPASLLQLGKVLLCAGKVKLARDALARADPVDPGPRALVDAYRRLTELADFGACRDWGPGPPPLDLSLTWSCAAWARERDDWYTRLPALPPSVRDEIWFVTQVASLPIELASARDPEESKPIFGRMVDALERVDAGGLELPLAIGVLATQVALARVIDERSEAQKGVLIGVQLCRDSGHEVGAALFGLLAHELSTANCTVSAALDLYAGDASELRRPVLSMLEERPPLEGATWPLDWQETRARFESTGWDLGIGAGLVVEASWTSRVKPADAPAALELEALANAREAFERAGDDAGCRIVECHSLAVSVEQSYTFASGRQDVAERLGSWGRTVGSTSFALALGLVLLAVGRRWQRRGDPGRALEAVRHGRAVFEGLAAPAACADAGFEEAELIAAAWERGSAVPSLVGAFDGYRQLLAEREAMLLASGFIDARSSLRNRLARSAAVLLAASAQYPAAVGRIRTQVVEAGIALGPVT